MDLTHHLLLLTIHHIVSDGWSNGILIRDLCTFYTAQSEGNAPRLPELPVQFADYADWQAARLAANDFAAQRAYWHQELSGSSSRLELPLDRPKRGAPSASSETRSRILPAELALAAKSLGAAQGASPFMVFIAIFQVLLHRYTNQADFLITTPGANRDRPEFESVVGPFANPLLLRANLRGDPDFRELLGRARTVTLEAFSNQDIPFETLLDEFQAGQLPVNFHYDTQWPRSLDLPQDVTIEVLSPISAGTVYELSATVLEEQSGLRLELEYKPSLFDSDTIERMLDHYEILLKNLLADPTQPVSNIPFLTPDEEQRFASRKIQPISELPPPAGSEASTTSEPVRPYLGLQLQLIAIWEDVLGVRGIGIRDNFFDLGGNSLLAIRMLQRAEAAFGKVIQPAALFRHPTIEHLAGEMAREEIDESPSILRVNDAGSRTPFFYLHGDLSGGGFYSMKLSRALGPDQPFYVMPPQDIRTLPAAPTIEEMAAAHLQALRAVRPKGPYVIGGFCIGGLVAFELARQIKTSGDTVEMLLIIDSAPESRMLRMLRRLASRMGSLCHWDDHEKVRRFGRWAIWHTRLAQATSRESAGQAPRSFSQRCGAVFDVLRNRLSFKKKTPAPVESGSSNQIERDLPSAFQWASAVYRPKPYDGPVALLLSEDVIGEESNPSREWQEFAPKTTIVALPGSHLECITEHVETLAKEIQDCLHSL